MNLDDLKLVQHHKENHWVSLVTTSTSKGSCLFELNSELKGTLTDDTSIFTVYFVMLPLRGITRTRAWWSYIKIPHKGMHICVLMTASIVMTDHIHIHPSVVSRHLEPGPFIQLNSVINTISQSGALRLALYVSLFLNCTSRYSHHKCVSCLPHEIQITVHNNIKIATLGNRIPLVVFI